MTSLTAQFAQRAAPAWGAHPLYRHWKRLLESPNVAALAVSIHRPREGLTYAPARLYVQAVPRDGIEREPGEYSWDPVANEGLIRLKARSIEKDDEVMRFALMAREAFRSIEGRVGDGYFNSVLLERLRTEPFDQQPKLSAMLGRVGREYLAHRDEAFDACLEQIESAIGELSEDLVAPERLGYTSDVADSILDAALAQYVDERFNVTNRNLLGW